MKAAGGVEHRGSEPGLTDIRHTRIDRGGWQSGAGRGLVVRRVGHLPVLQFVVSRKAPGLAGSRDAKVENTRMVSPVLQISILQRGSRVAFERGAEPRASQLARSRACAPLPLSTTSTSTGDRLPTSSFSDARLSSSKCSHISAHLGAALRVHKGTNSGSGHLGSTRHRARAVEAQHSGGSNRWDARSNPTGPAAGCGGGPAW